MPIGCEIIKCEYFKNGHCVNELLGCRKRIDALPEPLEVLTPETLMLLYSALNRAWVYTTVPQPPYDKDEVVDAIEIAKKKLDEINDRNERRI